MPDFELSYWPADRSRPLVEATLGSLLRDAAEATPDQVALVMGTRDPRKRLRWTYGDVLTRAQRAAHALLAEFEPGTRIAIWAPNVYQFFDVEFGTALAGMTLVPINPAFRAVEARHVLARSQAQGLFFWSCHRTNDIAEHVKELAPTLPQLRLAAPLEHWESFVEERPVSRELPTVDPSFAAQLQFTSGTTGPPKGVPFHHRGMTNMARFACERLGIGPGAVWVNPNPLFHASGCALSTVGPIAVRATQVCLEQFSPELLLEILESERGTMTGGVPTMLIAMMEHQDFATRDLSPLQTVMSGGSVVPPELVRRIEERFGAHFAVAFGQTETLGNVTQTKLTDSAEDKAGTIGQPLPHTEIKIVSADPDPGHIVAVGVPGEFCVRGPMIMTGYFEDMAMTKATLDADGWLHTGDVCTMDGRGYFRVAGRLTDIIIRGGENIAAREIEDLLYQHPAVAEAAVVGIPDPKWGEVVLAVVRLHAGEAATPAELTTYLEGSLAPFKMPRHWRFVDGFPLSAGGKIQKSVLRAAGVGSDDSQ